MKCKKIIAKILTAVLVVATATSCSSIKSSNVVKEDKNIAMGRFIEESVDMPEAVKAGKEIAYQMIKNSEGKLEIYSVALEPENAEVIIQYNLKEDYSWERKIPKWLNVEGFQPNSITYTLDGTRYAIASEYGEENVNVHILKSVDGEKSEEVVIDDFKKAVEYGDSPNGIEILPNNNILLTYSDHSSIYQEGKLLTSFESGGYAYTRSEDKLMILNEKRDGIYIMDSNTYKTISDIPFSSTIDSSAFTADKDGNWYMVSDTGIHRLVKGGSAWETIVDGALASMSMPSFSPDSIVTGENEDFYVMYQSENGKRDIKHYVYNKDVATTPSKTLTVVSLEENPTVRQAIIEFQRKNIDVKVDYRAVMSEEDGTTVSDHIKAINTELLAGKGDDILLLDGMPIDSYIEKGVLADLTSIINPMIDSGEILANIMEGYTIDGAIYTVPIRFAIPFALGEKEALKSVDSIQSLADYAKNTAEVPMLGSQTHTYSELTSLLFKLYSYRFIRSDGEFDREGLVQFIEQLKVICEQTEALKESKYSYDEMNELTTLGSMLLYDNQSELSLSEINSMYDVYMPMSVIEKTENDFATINGEFVPHGLVGINNASTEKDLSIEFIKELYAEKVQKEDLGDGFPVNSKALENFGMAEDDFNISTDTLTASQPSREKMKRIIDMGKTLNVPIDVDEILSDMVYEEVKSYLYGETDLQATADKIIAKTKAYLLE